MADFNLSWAIAGSTNNGLQTIQYRHYGDSLWTTYSTEAAGVITKTIVGLDDNKVYEFRIVNNCLTGEINPSNMLEQVVKVCPVFKQLTSEFCGEIEFAVEEIIGGDIIDYTINLYYPGNPTPIASYFALATNIPGATISDVFSNLLPNTTYQANIVLHIQGSILYTLTCPKTNITTIAAEVCDPITELLVAFGEGGSPSLEFTWTEPSPAPTNGYILYFRPVGSSAAYTQQAISSGEAGVTITGILSNTDYEGYIVSVCDACCTLPNPLCNNYSVHVPFETNDYNVIIGNSYYNTLTITGVTAGIGFSYSGVGVAYNETYHGHHEPLSHTIDITVAGDSTVSGNGHINILVNGTIVDCVDIPAGDYSGSEFSISSGIITLIDTDILTLSFENGDCMPIPPPTMLENIIVGTTVGTGVLGNICTATITETIYLDPIYTDIVTGCIAYTDSILTTPLTGYNYIGDTTGLVYNINSATGLVGSVSVTQCYS